jgi:hypothetical protein
MARVRRAALALIAAVAVAVAGAACSGGGGHHGSPTPTPLAAPANLKASGDFHRLALSWDAVLGADNYAVFLSTNAITSTTGLVPLGLTDTSTVVPGLPDWRTFHVRVAAEKGGVLGPLSAEATAMPAAGWIVASHTSSPFRLDTFHADETDVATASIPEGALLAQVGTGGSAVYAVVDSATGLNIALGLVSGTSNTPFASVTNHFYSWLGEAGTPAREIAWEFDGANYLVKSWSRAGADERTLVSGCAAAAPPEVVISPFGLIARCDAGGVKTFYSDALQAGVALPEPSTRSVLGLSATHAYFYDAGANTTYAQDFTGGAGSPLPGNVLLYIGNGRLLTRAFNGATYALDTCDEDGSNVAFAALNSPVTFDLYDALPDSSGVLLLSGGKALLVRLAIGGTNTDVTGGAGSADDVHYAGPGRIATRIAGTGWRIVSAADGSLVNALASTSGGAWQGSKGGWLVLDVPASSTLVSFSTDGSASHVLSTILAASPNVDFREDRRVLWLEADSTIHGASADGSLAPAMIDPSPATGLSDAGTGSYGRTFYVAGRASGEQVMVWDGATVSLVAGATTGESGLYLP